MFSAVPQHLTARLLVDAACRQGDCGSPTVDCVCSAQSELGFPAEALEPLNIGEAIPPLPSPALPPYNGYGTLDDSKQNCIALVPKPPKKV